MPIALQRHPAVSAASNDNGFGLLRRFDREAAFDGFWTAVRAAVTEGARLDYLAPGVLRVAGCATR